MWKFIRYPEVGPKPAFPGDEGEFVDDFIANHIGSHRERRSSAKHVDHTLLSEVWLCSP